MGANVDGCIKRTPRSCGTSVPAECHYRFQQNWWRNAPPDYWTAAVGYVATTDCAQVGKLIHARPVDAPVWSLLLVADCGGKGDYGLEWMLRNNIVAELDAATFDRWTAVYGRPLKIEMRGINE
ncbi:MAG: hypothetical protein LC131_02020 [Anaerolineae bacterium]|nr:hypothetical protein [Anaerolineae bacterium]